LTFRYQQGGEIIGTVICAFDGRRGYIHHVAVKPDEQNNTEEEDGSENESILIKEIRYPEQHTC